MSKKRKPNPCVPNAERAQAREQAAARQAPPKPTGQQSLARALAARAQDMIGKGLAAPSVIAGNAIALSRGREALEFDRLAGGAIRLDEAERKALARVMANYRLPSGWAGALQMEFDLVWSPKKPQAPERPAAPPARNGNGQAAQSRPAQNRAPQAKPANRPQAASGGQKTAAPSAPIVIVKRARRVETPADGSGGNA